MKLPRFGAAARSGSRNAESVAVIGLGRFGRALALELMEHGTEVLGLDSDRDIVQSLNSRLTHVVSGDSTREETLLELSIPDFDRVVVAIGTDLEASILTTSLLLELGVQQVWAKAVSDAHGAILRRLGVPHVVNPEREMGRRLAHLVRGTMQDFVELGDDFAAVRCAPPVEVVGLSVEAANTRERFGVTITAVQHPGAPWEPPTRATVIGPNDLLLVTGQTARAERFCSSDR